VSSVQATRASAVDNALGIQTDLTTGNWSSIPEMIAQATYIGAETVRVLSPTANNWTVKYGYVDQLANAGVKLDFLPDTSVSPGENASAIAAFLTAHPGSVRLIEGPNEPNNWGVNYAGQSGVAGAQAWQHDFYAALKANPMTAPIAVAGVSSYPAVAVASDENNLHVYPPYGDQPYASLAGANSVQSSVDPGKPFVITEFGWSTAPQSVSAGASVDEATQAKLLLNGYLDAVGLGATYVGLYALRDWPFTDFGAYYGMFHSDGAPKPAAAALHNLETILQDSGAGAGSFAPGSLDYSLTASAEVRSMLMQKSSGEFVLALWREPDVWNETAGVAIQPGGESVSIKLAAPANIAIYDPLVTDLATGSLAGARSLALTVTDHPVLLVLNAGSGPPVSNPAPPSHGNLLVNGGFETGPAPEAFTGLGAGSTAIAGWTVTGGNIDLIGDFWRAAEGAKSLDMNGSTAGSIAQTFATEVGHRYEVHFALAANFDDQRVHGIRAAAAGTSQDYYANAAGHTANAMGWSNQSFQFTATDVHTTLEFAGLDPSYWGAALDNVSVTPIDLAM
jgi:choice-of-anchor C domain-containing protein